MPLSAPEGFTPAVSALRALVWTSVFCGLTLSGCNCEEQLTVIFGELEVDPMEVDFGEVAVSLSKEATVSLRNGGARILQVQGLRTEGP